MEVRVVVDSDPLQLISLQEAKDYLKVDFDNQDAVIIDLIKGAYSAAEQETSRTFLPKTLKAYYSHVNQLTLPYGPVNEVVSASYTNYVGDPQIIEDFNLYGSEFSIPNQYCMKYPHQLTVEYTAGSGIVEAGIKLAILKMIFTLYEIQGNETTGVKGIGITQGLTITSKTLLRPFRRY